MEGTRLSCADVAHNLEELGRDRFFKTHTNLTEWDVLASLNYCAEQRCVGNAIAYCHSCQLRPGEAKGDRVWLLSEQLRREIGNVESK